MLHEESLEENQDCGYAGTFRCGRHTVLNFGALNHKIIPEQIKHHETSQATALHLTLNCTRRVKNLHNRVGTVLHRSPHGNRSLTCVTRVACPQACVRSLVEGPTPHAHADTHARAAVSVPIKPCISNNVSHPSRRS